MRVLVDLASHVTTGDPQITQVEKTPPIGTPGRTPIGGKYSIPIVPGANINVTKSDYVLNAGVVDGGDIASQSYAWLLARYPSFEWVYFNPLLTPDHVAELDLSATFGGFPTRAQTGRITAAPFPPGTGGPFPAGQMPSHTAILGQNNTVAPPRPGLLVTQDIDISAYTGMAGTDTVMPFYKIYDFDVSEDISSDYGVFAGQNSPSIRYLIERDQEPAGFSVYISPDGGVSWVNAMLLAPVTFMANTTTIKLAFENTTANKIFLATFGFLF